MTFRSGTWRLTSCHVTEHVSKRDYTSMYTIARCDVFVLRRGRKPGSGRKNGGAGAKGKDKKLSGTESEQEVGLVDELTSA